MDQRFALLAAAAATNHGLVDIGLARRLGVTVRMRLRWCTMGLLEQVAPRVYRLAGAPITWRQGLVAGVCSLPKNAMVAGRSGARLAGFDGFVEGEAEFIAPRAARSRAVDGRVVYTSRAIPAGDRRYIDGIPVLGAERLILESPLFGFTNIETENSIDSAIRLRLTTHARLVMRLERDVPTGVRGRSILCAALIDAGGESRLERLFLRMVRTAGLPRPTLQRTYRNGGRVVARVDAAFPGGLIVELNGHGTHSSRRQRQRDAQRHTELTLRGNRVLTFTYEDQVERPDWMMQQLRSAGVKAA